jgi:hypothetical protein
MYAKYLMKLWLPPITSWSNEAEQSKVGSICLDDINPDVVRMVPVSCAAAQSKSISPVILETIAR